MNANLLAARLKKKKEEKEGAHKFEFVVEDDASPEYLDTSGNLTMLPSKACTQEGMRELMIQGIEGWLKRKFYEGLGQKYPESVYGKWVELWEK